MLNSIRIFVKIVEQVNFSKAGRILSMTPSSVTRNIDHLENELGVTLFKRSTRQLILTDEGNTFLAGANKLLAQAIELSESLKSISAEPSDPQLWQGIYRHYPITGIKSASFLCKR